MKKMTDFEKLKEAGVIDHEGDWITYQICKYVTSPFKPKK